MNESPETEPNPEAGQTLAPTAGYALEETRVETAGVIRCCLQGVAMEYKAQEPEIHETLEKFRGLRRAAESMFAAVRNENERRLSSNEPLIHAEHAMMLALGETESL